MPLSQPCIQFWSEERKQYTVNNRLNRSRSWIISSRFTYSFAFCLIFLRDIDRQQDAKAWRPRFPRIPRPRFPRIPRPRFPRIPRPRFPRIPRPRFPRIPRPRFPRIPRPRFPRIPRPRFPRIPPPRFPRRRFRGWGKK